MLNKSIGSLHSVPAPSAAVLGESLKLLATFGDKKSIGPLLEQMRDVQAQNEQVFREAQAALGELTAGVKELEDSRKAFATVKVEEDLGIKRRLEQLSQAEARLSGKVAKFDEDNDAASAALDDRQRELTDRERAIIVRESKCEAKESDLIRRNSVAEKSEAALRAKEQQLQAKEQKLRAALDGG